MMTKTALILRHVHFEDLGHFARPLADAAYSTVYSDVSDPDFCKSDPLVPGLLVVLGGPISVYETDTYPFLLQELEFIRKRVVANKPTLGVCLGAQLIAASLNAKVYSSGHKEIGFSRLHLSHEGTQGPLRHLNEVEVLHWHGDTYSLPSSAQNLASTNLIEQQAFSIGANVLGLQFHPEAETGASFERWLVGHAAELASAKVDVAALRRDGRHNADALRAASALLLAEWFGGLES